MFSSTLNEYIYSMVCMHFMSFYLLFTTYYFGLSVRKSQSGVYGQEQGLARIVKFGIHVADVKLHVIYFPDSEQQRC